MEIIIYVSIGIFLFFFFSKPFLRIRKKKARKYWCNWNNATTFVNNTDYVLIRIKTIKQSAKSGTKAYVEWIIGDGPESVWFNNFWPKSGCFLIVGGDIGYGTHHGERVFYVNSIERTLHPLTFTAWKQHEKRLKNETVKINNIPIPIEEGTLKNEINLSTNSPSDKVKKSDNCMKNKPERKATTDIIKYQDLFRYWDVILRYSNLDNFLKCKHKIKLSNLYGDNPKLLQTGSLEDKHKHIVSHWFKTLPIDDDDGCISGSILFVNLFNHRKKENYQNLQQVFATVGIRIHPDGYITPDISQGIRWNLMNFSPSDANDSRIILNEKDFLIKHQNKLMALPDNIDWQTYWKSFRAFCATIHSNDLKESLPPTISRPEADQFPGFYMVGLDNDASEGATIRIRRAYSDLLQTTVPPLLNSFLGVFSSAQSYLKKSSQCRQSIACLGHMDEEDFDKQSRACWPLDTAQREALVHYSAMENGTLLAINGPPGTGKTSMLKGVIASEWVSHTIKNNHPDPLWIIATGATNKSVTNIIGAFNTISAKKISAPEWMYRWVPQVNSYGWYVPAPSSYNTAIKNIKKQYEGENLSNDEIELKYDFQVLSLDTKKKKCWLRGKAVDLKGCIFKTFNLEKVYRDKLHRTFPTYKNRTLSLELQSIHTELKNNEKNGIRVPVALLEKLMEHAFQRISKAPNDSVQWISANIQKLDVQLKSWNTEKSKEKDNLENYKSQALQYESEANQHLVNIKDHLIELEKKHRNINEFLSRVEKIQPKRYYKWFRYLKRLKTWPKLQVLLKANFPSPSNDNNIQDPSVWNIHLSQLNNEILNKIESSTQQYQTLQKVLYGKEKNSMNLQFIESRNNAINIQRTHEEEVKNLNEKIINIRGQIQKQKQLLDQKISEDEVARKLLIKLIDCLQVYCQKTKNWKDDDPQKILECWERITKSNDIKDFYETIQQFLDKGTRLYSFHLCGRYWEGRWIEKIKKLRTEKGTELNNLPMIEQIRTHAMLAPITVATMAYLPGLFQTGKTTQFGQADLLIVDEAGQATAEQGTVAFSFAKKAIVVGDVDQLEPVWSVNKPTNDTILHQLDLYAYKLNIEKRSMSAASGNIMSMAQKASKFSLPRSAHPGLLLSNHYRCVKPIIQYCCELVYGDDLHPKRDVSYDKKLFLPPVSYVAVESTPLKSGSSWINFEEAEKIADWLAFNRNKLLNHYQKTHLKDVVAILVPFRPQVDHIRQALSKHMAKHGFTNSKSEVNEITIGTVHSLQGDEKPVVIFCGVIRPGLDSTFIDRSHSLLNVAVSRAKDSFIIVAHPDFLAQRGNQTPSQLLADYMHRNGRRLFPKTLIIVESPNKSSKLREWLGPDIVCLPTNGHFRMLQFENNQAIDINNAFKPKWQINPDHQNVINAIKTELDYCEELIIATDPDAEGEAIAWHLLDELNSDSQLIGTRVLRMQFHQLTRESIITAIENARLNKTRFEPNKAKAAIIRQVVDFLIGQHLNDLSKNGTLPKGLGRVSIAMLELLYKQHERIEKNGNKCFIQPLTLKVDQTNFKGYMLPDSHRMHWAENELLNKNKVIKSNIADLQQYQYPQKIEKRKAINTLDLLVESWYRFGHLPEETQDVLQALYEMTIGKD